MLRPRFPVRNLEVFQKPSNCNLFRRILSFGTETFSNTDSLKADDTTCRSSNDWTCLTIRRFHLHLRIEKQMAK